MRGSSRPIGSGLDVTDARPGVPAACESPPSFSSSDQLPAVDREAPAGRAENLEGRIRVEPSSPGHDGISGG